MQEKIVPNLSLRLFQTMSVPRGKVGNSQHFPTNLHSMLDDAEKMGFEKIISWCCKGQSFKIHNENELVNLLGCYFRMKRYKSFLRQLQSYSFKRVTKGVDKGIVSHPLFVRGRRSLCFRMSRKAAGSVQRHLAKKQHGQINGVLRNSILGAIPGDSIVPIRGIDSAPSSNAPFIGAMLVKTGSGKQDFMLANKTTSNGTFKVQRQNPKQHQSKGIPTNGNSINIPQELSNGSRSKRRASMPPMMGSATATNIAGTIYSNNRRRSADAAMIRSAVAAAAAINDNDGVALLNQNDPLETTTLNPFPSNSYCLAEGKLESVIRSASVGDIEPTPIDSIVPSRILSLPQQDGQEHQPLPGNYRFQYMQEHPESQRYATVNNQTEGHGLRPMHSKFQKQQGSYRQQHYNFKQQNNSVLYEKVVLRSGVNASEQLVNTKTTACQQAEDKANIQERLRHEPHVTRQQNQFNWLSHENQYQSNASRNNLARHLFGSDELDNSINRLLQQPSDWWQSQQRPSHHQIQSDFKIQTNSLAEFDQSFSALSRIEPRDSARKAFGIGTKNSGNLSELKLSSSTQLNFVPSALPSLSNYSNKSNTDQQEQVLNQPPTNENTSSKKIPNAYSRGVQTMDLYTSQQAEDSSRQQSFQMPFEKTFHQQDLSQERSTICYMQTLQQYKSKRHASEVFIGIEKVPSSLCIDDDSPCPVDSLLMDGGGLDEW